MNLKKKTIIAFLIFLVVFSPPCFADELDYSDNFELNSLETSADISSVPSLNSRSAIILEKSTGTVLFRQK